MCPEAQSGRSQVDWDEIDTCIPEPFVLQDKIKLKINFDISYDLM